jgi:protein gp37
MADKSAIEWTDATWNPVTGCTQISPGCDHCYAMTFAERFRGVEGHPYANGFDLTVRSDRLLLPLKWKRPRRIFVNSMSDLFHEKVPKPFIHQIFQTMEAGNWHTYQLLTKRPHRIVRLVDELPWPAHVWVGVSVELANFAWRVDRLRQVPSAVRFISAEPLLGPLDDICLDGIDWVITGGESGARSRPCNYEWVARLRDRCISEGIAFFHKQWGGRTPKANGRQIDGRTWNEFPNPSPQRG